MNLSPTEPRKVPDSVRRHIYFTHGILLFAVFTAIAWTLYGAYAFLKFDVLSFLGHGGDEGFKKKLASFLYPAVALLTPIVVAIIGWVRIGRALRLAQYGVEVVANVTGLGGTYQGLTRVDFQYSVGGRTITNALSKDSDEAKQLLDGTEQLVLIVEPSNPKRYMEKYQVFPREEA